MIENSSRTVVCSVVFLDIAEYSKKPVTVQLQIKQRCNELLAAALEPIASRDRVVLDTGDGAAITFLGDPEDALFVAMSLRSAVLGAPSVGLALRIGVNLGPVRLVRDLNGQMNIIGDGINVAQRVMAFAEPGQLLVSRSFYEVVSCLSHDYTGLFNYVGARTDKHVREHEVYAVRTNAAATQWLAQTVSRRKASGSRTAGWLAALAQPGPFGVQRLALFSAPLVFALFVGSGAALRVALHRPAAVLPQAAAPLAAKPAPVAAQAQPVPPAEVPQSATAPPEPERPQHTARPATRIAAKRAPAAPRREHARPPAPVHGTVALAIAPWGEVLVDGNVRGISPPLNSIELSPGAHTIEIRNTTFPSYVERIEVQPGQQVRVRHLFK
ncbi:MAG TPA: adenylate/guanylate cyclase domain-containing protein [Burkholderiales bacterium]|nr:adenylate/guanylate cyclase domain-containing protein [Burkholderiales bacterium]